jgi:hypothetical protein
MIKIMNGPIYSHTSTNKFMSRYWFLFILLLCLFCQSTTACHGSEILVKNTIELAQGLQKLKPGDHLVLADGIWVDQYISFSGHGMPKAPITLRAQTPGKVIMTGKSRLDISGSWLIVDGLRFENGALEKGQHVIRFTGASGAANNSRLTNSTIINYNPANLKTRYFWVSLHGINNRVDHNRFEGQKNSGVTVAVSHRNGIEDRHLIERNYFLNRPAGKGNGFETIRIGTSDSSLSDSSTVVQHNLFERTDGEAEVISVKSGNNDIRYNTFSRVAGTVSLRHGNGNRVVGNYFLGGNAPATGGIRIMGENHLVANNYLQDLAGLDGGGILLICGNPDNKLAGYARVRNTVIAHNTLVDTGRPSIKLDRGCGKSDQTQLPENITIINNLISSKAAPLIEGQEGAKWTWSGNILYGASPGITPRPGVIIADPRLVKTAGGLWRPAVGSPAKNAGKANRFVNTDMDGQLRNHFFDIGADEISAAAVKFRPLTPQVVGPVWWKSSSQGRH